MIRIRMEAPTPIKIAGIVEEGIPSNIICCFKNYFIGSMVFRLFFLFLLTFGQIVRTKIKNNIAISSCVGTDEQCSIFSEKLPFEKKFNTTFHFLKVMTRSNYGTTFIDVDSRIKFIIWRGTNQQYYYSHLHTNSTPSSFILEANNPHQCRFVMDFLSDFNLLYNLQIFVIKLNDTIIIGKEVNITVSTIGVGTLNLEPNKYYQLNFEDSHQTTYPSGMESKKLVYNIARRYELYHISFFILFMLFYILIMILIVLFRRKQPLRSRGVVPFMAVCIQFLILFADVILCWVLPLDRNSNGYFIDYFIIFPLLVTLFTCVVSLNIRYNILSYMSKKRIEMYEHKDSNQNIKFLFKILRAFKQWYVVLPTSLAFYLITCLLYFFFGLGTNWDLELSDYGVFVFAIIVSIYYITVILNMAFDFFQNWKELSRCDFIGHLKRDPIWFKTEIYIISSFTYIYFLLSAIIIAIVDIPMVPRVIIVSLQYNLCFFTSSLFPLIITIISWIKSLLTKTEDLRLLLNDPDCYQVFYEFTKNEFSTENLTCFQDIHEYNLEKVVERKKVLGKKIFYSYFNEDNSEFEVNVEKGVRQEIKEKIENDIYGNDLFEGATRTLITNLYDTFSRLKYTNEWQNFEEKKQYFKEIRPN